MAVETGRPAQPIRAPRGATLTCKGWAQEAALRMLMNNLASPNRETESMRDGSDAIADGTPDAARRLERVLTTDLGSGIMRHADAGYPEAIAAAGRHGLDLPGVTT